MNALLKIEDLTASYGGMRVLFGVNMEVGQGEIVSLIGGNGAGKTTFIRVISRLTDADGGRVILGGEDITRLTPGAVVARRVATVPEGRRLFAKMTVLENLELGSYTRGARLSRRENLEYVLGLFPDLGGRLRDRAGSLSGGQQQMVAIARALMASPSMLILDEPSIGLSPIVTQAVFEAVRRIRDSGVTVLISEQNVADVLKMADRAFVMEHGRIVLSGSGQDMMQNEYLRKAYLGL